MKKGILGGPSKVVRAALRYRNTTQLKALAESSSGWDVNNWSFGSSGQYSTLRLCESEGVSQVRGRIICGQLDGVREVGERLSCTGRPDPGRFPDLVKNDGDGLMEIWDLEDSDNMRNSLAGTPYRTPSVDGGSTKGRGTNIPLDLDGRKKGRCNGYELMVNLDFGDDNAAGYSREWVAGKERLLGLGTDIADDPTEARILADPLSAPPAPTISRAPLGEWAHNIQPACKPRIHKWNKCLCWPVQSCHGQAAKYRPVCIRGVPPRLMALLGKADIGSTIMDGYAIGSVTSTAANASNVHTGEVASNGTTTGCHYSGGSKGKDKHDDRCSTRHLP